MKAKHLILMVIITLLMAWAYSEPIQTIGISTADVNSVPTVTVEIVAETECKVYLLDNPDIGVALGELERTETKYNYGVRVWNPPKPIATIKSFKTSLIISDPNLVDFAGTGSSFGFGITGRWSEFAITVNGKRYVNTPIVTMADVDRLIALWRNNPVITKPDEPIEVPKILGYVGTGKIHQKICRYYKPDMKPVYEITDPNNLCKLCN